MGAAAPSVDSTVNSATSTTSGRTSTAPPQNPLPRSGGSDGGGLNVLIIVAGTALAAAAVAGGVAYALLASADRQRGLRRRRRRHAVRSSAAALSSAAKGGQARGIGGASSALNTSPSSISAPQQDIPYEHPGTASEQVGCACPAVSTIGAPQTDKECCRARICGWIRIPMALHHKR